MRRAGSSIQGLPSLGGYSHLSYYVVVLGLWLLVAIQSVYTDPVGTLRTDLGLEFVLLVVTGLVLALWTVAFGRGRVGLGTGAGFRVACFAIAAHMQVTALLSWFGDPGGRLFGRLVPEVRMPIALVRNASLIAFGLGLTLVVASSVSDWIRRRDEPAHVQPVD